MNGAERIAVERTRQIEEEGWTPYHDGGHTSGELAHAAVYYAAGEPVYFLRRYAINGDPRLPHQHFENAWPFEAKWYKPKDRLRDLVRAGALIAAEIDRLLAVPVQTEEEEG